MATTLGAKAIGSIVRLKENGVFKEFIIAKQGYPAAGNGRILLLRRGLCEPLVWASSVYNAYAGSNVDAWLNGAYIAKLDADIQAQVAAVNILYTPGNNNNAVTTLLRKVFLLAGTEVGLGTHWMNGEGSDLGLFANDTARIGYLEGAQTSAEWWLRSPATMYANEAWYVGTNGSPYSRNVIKALSVRPALTLPASLWVTGDGSVTTNQPPSTPTSITVPATVKGGAPLAISWGGSSDPDGNLSGYRLERSVNNGGYGQIYQGGATSYTDQITYGWGSVAYRVKAYDALGVESGYITSTTRAVVNNSAPSAPASISVPATVRGGKACSVSWGAATDVDGNLAGYKLERSVNGGGYAQIYAGTARSFNDTITRGWVSVIYRVRAYDAENAHSGYTTAPSRTVVNNLAPVISGADGDLGLKSGAFSQTYSVTDDDGDPITVTEKLDAATLRTYTATAGATNTLTIDADRFMRTLNGRRTVSATAKDNQGGATTRTWTFTKSVTSLSVKLKTPLPADAAVTKCVLNVVREIPLGADFTVEVCNNAFDVSPTWEDATAAVLSGRKYFLANTTKTAANWGFNLRIAVDRKNTVGECYIAGIGGAFA